MIARRGVPAEGAAKGREAARSKESREKIAASKRGKPAHPNTRAALLKAAQAPKPAGWGERANRWMMQGKMTNRPTTAVAAWQERMGITDREAAELLELSLSSYQRHKLGRQGDLTATTKRHLLLACAAIEAGLPSISERNINKKN